MRPIGKDERRQYFRIIDEIDVSYQVVDESESDQSHPVEHGFDKMNAEIKAALSDLNDDHPAVSTALGLLNKKLDMMIAVAELEHAQAQLAAYQADEVSISASGIAFPVKDQLANDTLLDLSLYLHASDQRVAIRGQVVGCQAVESDVEPKYCLRVEFIDVDDSTRENLIQYILQRQRYLLKNLSEDLYHGLSES